MAQGKKLGKIKAMNALRASGGVVSEAAEALGVNRSTLHKYINEHDDVRAVYEESNETNLDAVEAVLIGQAKSGDREQVRFYLRTKGKSRGYGDRLEHAGVEGGPPILIRRVNDAE